MPTSYTPPDSATTVQGSFGSLEDEILRDGPEGGDPLSRARTVQDDGDENESNEKYNRRKSIKPLERKPTYIREFWLFRMRAADDDEMK